MQVHLVRHGEVANPNHIVYGDLPGFNLSPLGVRQARAAADHLAGFPIGAVITSPLARARQTAAAIAGPHSVAPIVDGRLVETRQFPHWTGLTWEAVVRRYRDEFSRYLSDATSVRSGTETIDQVATRVAAAITDRSPDRGDLVVVGHQDPTQAVRLALTGRSLSDLRADPPGHASVVTIERATSGWVEASRWAAPI